MNKIKDFFYISDIGKTRIIKAVIAGVISNIILMLPIIISVEFLVEILKPLSGEEIQWKHIWLLMFLGLILAILMFISYIYEHRKTFVASYVESENQRIKVAERLRKLPMNFFQTKDLTEITTNIMADCASIEKIMSHILPQLIATSISTIIIIICLFFIDWRLAMCTIVTIPIALLVIWASRRIHKKWVKRLTKLKLEQESAVQEYIEGIKVIKSCRTSKTNYKQLNNILVTMKQMMIKGEIITGSFFTGSQIILQCGTGITILVGVFLYLNGSINVIPILLFCMISIRIYGPILAQLESLAELMYYRFATERMRQLMKLPIMSGKSDVESSNVSINMENVSFAYSDEMVLKNISASFEENQITAIVGPSGSGKSTIANLITRFWDVTSGKITIGDIDIKDIIPENLMKNISIVFQNVNLFNDSIYNNIKIGNINATDQQIRDVAKATGCDEIIKKLPNGYDSLLGENGSKLSGGERQRISIARALLKNAPIVILDEATASLDPENEKYVQDGISKLVKGKTVIVIAHKLKTIASADKIIVINNGRIEEIGNHKELMSNKGLYNKLFNMQDNSSKWSVKI